MKLFITSILLSSSIFASVCETNLTDRALGDIVSWDGEKTFFTELGSGEIKLSKEEFEANITFKDFDYDSCSEALVYSLFTYEVTGQKFLAIYSNDDSCDGGNSYGYITEADKDEVIATVQDSDFYCL